MTSPSTRCLLIRKMLDELNQRYDAATVRGESDVHLALCRFKIDELQAALAREEKRAA